MKMKKFLFTCAAVAGVSAALAANAFAEVVENDTYNKEAGTVSIKTSLTDKAGDQMTVLIIPADAYEKGTITDSDIIYIDQAEALADANIFQNMGLLNGTALADGEYYIKIGGENIAQDGIIVEKFTVGGGQITYLYGDVNGSGGYPDLDDATEIINYVLWEASVFDDEAPWRFEIGNITPDRDTNDAIDLDDATEIINYVLWEPSNLDKLLPAE